MASSSSTAFLVETGPWQRAYWTLGCAGAQKHCTQQIAEIQEKLAFITSLLMQTGDCHSASSGLKKLASLYCEKVTRYEPDRKFGSSFETRLLSRGRGERGRTPFQYPDFRHRFTCAQKLRDFFSSKIQMHETALKAIEEAFVAFPKNVGLEELQSAHRMAHGKWSARNGQSDLSHWLIPRKEMSAHELMGIKWAHDQGFKGAGARAFLIEKGIDPKHPALKDAIAPFEQKTALEKKAIRHGTHVAGVIAARKSEQSSYDHIGVAPCATLEFSPFTIPVTADKAGICIANHSQGIESPLGRFLENFDGFSSEMILTLMDLAAAFPFLMGDCMKVMSAEKDEAKDLLESLNKMILKTTMKHYLADFKDSLIVDSIGNNGVDFSEVPELREEEVYILDRLDSVIRVVNLRQNGLYPHPTSSLPGAELGDATISAIGTKVLSTIPENDYEALTGTSMAAPFVTGVALLLRAAFPDLLPMQIRQCILESATPIVLDANKTPHLIQNPEDLAQYTAEQIADSKRFYGRGLLNAKGAIEYAQKLSSTSDPQP